MNLDGALKIAAGGLANINRQMAVISQNVANASTPGYAVEHGTQQSLTADGQGLGVHSGPVVRTIDTALQAELFTQNATVAGLQTRQSALQAIDAVSGTPGQGGDIASMLGDLQDQFSTLLNSPGNQAQQARVVTTAGALARGINALSTSYTAQRQTAQDSIVADITTVNDTLATLGDLSSKIVALKAGGQSTADLENQRDGALGTLSQLVDVKVLEQPNGDILVTTTGGLSLPIRGVTNPLSINGANMQPGGSAPAIKLAGVNVTSQLRGGQIGANIALRDTTLPAYQASLDDLALKLANGFDGQGLTLFTNPDGTVPAGSVGFAASVQVNPVVQADPTKVRDGTAMPPTGLAGYTGTIQSVLSHTFGDAPTLGSAAAALVASQAQDSASTTNQLATEQAVQTTWSNKLAAGSGVNMDTEMSTMIQLQNAYGANARVIAAVQAMWTQLLNSVQ